MSLNATWITIAWTTAGAATAVATRSITTKYLTRSTSDTTARPLFDGAPRPPPIAPLTAGQVVATATLFGLLAWRFGPCVELLAFSCLAAVAVPLSVIDTLELRLPRQLVLSTYPACITLFGLAAAVNDDWTRLARALAGMLILLAGYLMTAVLSHGGLGAGDVRTAGPIGLALTWLSWPTLLAGTLYSLLILIATAPVTNTTEAFPRKEVPFGPAMFSGAFISILTPQ